MGPVEGGWCSEISRGYEVGGFSWAFAVVGFLSKLDTEKTACKFNFGWFLDKDPVCSNMDG